MITVSALAAAWNGFFHVPEPAHTIALFRILLGLLLLVNAALFTRDARLWIRPAGIFAYDEFCRINGHSRFTLLRYLPATFGSVRLVLGVHLPRCAALQWGGGHPGAQGWSSSRW